MPILPILFFHHIINCIFGHLIWRDDSLEKILMLGKIEGKKRRRQQRRRWLDGITGSVDMSLDWHSAVHRVAESQTWLSNWKTTTVFWLDYMKTGCCSLRQLSESALQHEISGPCGLFPINLLWTILFSHFHPSDNSKAFQA